MYQGAAAITTLHLLYQDSMIRVGGSCLHIVYPDAGAWVHIYVPSRRRLGTHFGSLSTECYPSVEWQSHFYFFNMKMDFKTLKPFDFLNFILTYPMVLQTGNTRYLRSQNVYPGAGAWVHIYVPRRQCLIGWLQSSTNQGS